MTHKEFMNLELENIVERELVPGFIAIRFTIKECRYNIRVSLTENGYIVRGLVHFDGEKPCQLCNSSKQLKCDSLESYRDALFQRLVHSKELRLLWVTREYKWD